MEEDESQQESGKLGKFRAFVHECARVLRITKKPTNEEFKTIVKVSGFGMMVIGLIGFLVTMVRQLLFK